MLFHQHRALPKRQPSVLSSSLTVDFRGSLFFLPSILFFVKINPKGGFFRCSLAVLEASSKKPQPQNMTSRTTTATAETAKTNSCPLTLLPLPRAQCHHRKLDPTASNLLYSVGVVLEVLNQRSHSSWGAPARAQCPRTAPVEAPQRQNASRQHCSAKVLFVAEKRDLLQPYIPTPSCRLIKKPPDGHLVPGRSLPSPVPTRLHKSTTVSQQSRKASFLCSDKLSTAAFSM